MRSLVESLAFLLIAIFTSFKAESKPNILFIIADDLGWGNVGFHNKENDEIQTPFIDDLVANGLELNRHYTYSGCSPSRTSFQTGRLPIHVNTNNHDGITNPVVGIPLEMTTIASKLQTAGYGTHMVGKWDCGHSTTHHLPLNKGYDSFYGYLGKSIWYFSKITYQRCGEGVVDLWEDDGPAFSSKDQVNTERFIEFEFAEKVKDIITSYEDSDDPFFIVYSMHLPHFPSQIPEDHLVESFGEDESDCSINTDYIFPGFTNGNLFHCRSAYQSQVKLLDNVIGSLAETLKEADLWDNTLIVFTSDNGGSLELNSTAGNNWPLRGAKTSTLEGGVRSTAFVSGGYLPDERSGQVESGLMHLADWYTTFCSLAGIESTDEYATNRGVPDVDGLDMWPLISGQIKESPRSELAISDDTLMWHNYKLLIGSHRYAVWQSPIFPNSSSQSQSELMNTILQCGQEGCLFDVVNDPSEYNDLSELSEYNEIITTMREKLNGVIAESIWENEEYAIDLCPGDVEYDTDIDCCGCWMALNEYNGFVGPYQRLLNDEDTFVMTNEDYSIGFIVAKVNDYVYVIGLSIGFAILLTVMKCFCGSRKNTERMSKEASYGALLKYNSMSF